MTTDSTSTIHCPHTDTHPLPRVAVSRCLIGDNVRYDGGHKKDLLLTDTLSRYVDFMSICPEVETGMPVPREPVQLENHGGSLRLVAPESGHDWTRSMTEYCARRLPLLARVHLSGFIVQKKSPSCGLNRVNVFTPGDSVPQESGIGMFTAALAKAFPWLPMTESDLLQDPLHRSHFLEQIFACQRLSQLLDSDWQTGELVAFHSKEKYLLLAHDEAAYRALGKMVARAGELSSGDISTPYRTRFMAAMKRIATPATHTNVLQHIAGYFKKNTGKQERTQLTNAIARYHAGLVPLAVPIALLRRHAMAQNQQYLIEQTYLNPYPELLMRLNNTDAPSTND